MQPPKKRRRLQNESKLLVPRNETMQSASALLELPAYEIQRTLDRKTIQRLIRKLKNAQAISESEKQSSPERQSERKPILTGLQKSEKFTENSMSVIEKLRTRGYSGIKIVDVGQVSFNEVGDEIPNTCLGRALVAASGFPVDHPSFDRYALNMLQIIGSAPEEVGKLIQQGTLGAGKMYSNFWLMESMKYPISALYFSAIWVVQRTSTTLFIGPGYDPIRGKLLVLYYSNLHYQIVTRANGELLNISANVVKNLISQEPTIHTIIPKIRTAK